MATHSSILSWEIPGTEEPGGLQSMGVTESQAKTEPHRAQTQELSFLREFRLT